MERAQILVVDDKENMLRLFEKMLGDSYDVTTTPDGTRALALIGSHPFDVVVSDIRMPGADGIEVLRAVKQRAPDTEVVLMTAYASIAAAVDAIKQGAYDYIQKPFEPDEVSLVVARALERKRLREQAAHLSRELHDVFGFDNLIGKSPRMREVYDLLKHAAELDITVLIRGDSGTGKELAARAVHHESARRERRFVAVNCGALPAELVESELFGHARGAFTGAAAAKAGLFEEAEGGTLFLDEIGELPLATQVKLNRALQEHEVRRVGENRPIKVDVRIIAATHRDLKTEVDAGRFREDLFYRLNVFPVRMPSLRDRPEDIPLLAAHFLDKHSKALRRPVEGFEPEALRALTGYAWPGNVRELENAVERAIAITRGTRLTVEDLPDEIRGTAPGPLPPDVLVRMPFRDAVETARESASRDYLAALLHEYGGNVTHAAERAGMERESLHRLLRRYGLKSDSFKAGD
jgi:two-component system response regulator HydG